jgi:hypothetical protein
VGVDGVEAVADAEHLARLDLEVGGLALEHAADEGWCMRLRLFWSAKRLPLVPEHASRLPMLAACPMM